MLHLNFPIQNEKEMLKEEVTGFLPPLLHASVFIGGSYFFPTRRAVCFRNGASDLDILVICKRNKQNQKILEEICNKEIVEQYMNGYYDIVNVTHQYGSGRNALHVKFMTVELYEKITLMQEIQFRSYRQSSLSMKTLVSFTHSRNVPPLELSYHETENPWGHTLHYDFTPIQNHRLFLSDIHSMVLFSECIKDQVEVLPMRKKMIDNIQTFTKGCDSEKDVLHMFGYFYNKNLMNHEVEKVLLKLFWNKQKRE